MRPGAAGLVLGDAGWFLPVDDGPRSLGGALAWAFAHDVDQLNVLSESAPATLARRAAPFDPAPSSGRCDGTELSAAVARAAGAPT